MKDAKTGQTVTITVHRDGKPVELKLLLGAPKATTQIVESLGNTDQYAGGKLSKRRTDFPQAIETDAAVWADQCGGPVVNLQGDAVAITIARYDRTCTLALPARLVRETVDKVRGAAKS
jgi:S1-C subfamily serine protease